MTVFFLALSLCINIFFLFMIIFLFQEKEYWHAKFMDAIEQIYPPVRWDYTREGGWIDDDDQRNEDQ